MCRLLYHNNDPLGNSNEDVSNPSSLIMQNIFPLPKIPDAEEKEKVLLNVYVDSGKASRRNKGFRNEYICFDIVCHLNLWKIPEGIRPYSISNELDKLFNNKYIAGVSLNNIYFDTWRGQQYSNYYYGYKLVYQLTNNSNLIKNDSGV